MPPLVEVWETFVPGAELGPFLTSSKGTPTKMVFSVQLIGVVIVHGVGKQIISRPLVMDLKSCISFH